MKILFAILLVLLIFIFPQSVGAEELDRLQIFFFEIGDDGEDVLNYYHIAVPSRLSVEDRAIVVFSEIFDNADADKMIYAPPQVRILDIIFHGAASHLVVNLSAEILNYGGTHFEDRLIYKLLINAAGIGNVAYLTILIDGRPQYFPEGTIILKNSLALFNCPRIKIFLQF
ncbi:MAG: GerMN domain-containing protein [Clostridiales bacterium]|nr:GerMN domain-containing protein [Clostridiales bacterium]